MNAPDKLATLLALTREPFPASTKIHIPGEIHPDVRVPMREVLLTNGEQVTIYDTSGPYTDPAAKIDVRKGLQTCVAHGSTSALTPKNMQAAFANLLMMACAAH